MLSQVRLGPSAAKPSVDLRDRYRVAPEWLAEPRGAVDRVKAKTEDNVDLVGSRCHDRPFRASDRLLARNDRRLTRGRTDGNRRALP